MPAKDGFQPPSCVEIVERSVSGETGFERVGSKPADANFFIRELENFIERLLVLRQGQSLIGVPELAIENEIARVPTTGWNFELEDDLPTLDELSDKYTRYVLDRVGQHQGEAARVLGISRRTISRKVAIFQTEGAS